MTTAERHREWMKERYGEDWDTKYVPPSSKWERLPILVKLPLITLGVIGGLALSPILVPVVIIWALVWYFWGLWRDGDYGNDDLMHYIITGEDRTGEIWKIPGAIERRNAHVDRTGRPF